MSRAITRRQALGGIAASLVAPAALGACSRRAQPAPPHDAAASPDGSGEAGSVPLGPYDANATRPPNLVLIIADDQAAKAVGSVGAFPFLATPGMDRLGAEGATFSNMFVTTSLCSPSRASILTGCYAHTHGVKSNDTNDPNPDLPQFPALLQQAGYRTAFIGKWHMASGADNAAPRPGFDEWLVPPGQGDYNDPWLNDNGALAQVPGYITDILTDRAIQWISDNRDSPFCLILAHKAVHDPRTPAARYASALADASVPEPASFQDDFFGKPAWLRRGVLYGQDSSAWQASLGLPIPDRLPPATWNAQDSYLLDYFRCLLALDDSIGRVLEALADLGILEQTCVAHMSDNGYFLGEHRFDDKRLMYEESLRVPLLVRYPRVFSPGSSIPGMALNIDLAPTFLALAGVNQPASMAGESLLPLGAGMPSTWRKSFLYEYWMEGWLPGIPSMRGVRTESTKLIRYPDVVGDVDELYDLANDPLELDNRIQDPAYAQTLAALDAELLRLAGA